MSTPSRIILKLKKEDIGRKVKFDPIKLPLPLHEWIERDGIGKVWLNKKDVEKSKAVTLKGEYIGIYCHWDGRLDSTGDVLCESFNDYETALNLIVGGFCSGIASGHVAHYANRIGEKWTDIEPIQGSINTIRTKIYGQYEYIFENGSWKGAKC